MTHVLPVVTLELRHPVANVVGGKADDPAHHAGERTSAPS